MPYNMRKRITNVSDNDSESDEDYIPLENCVSLKEINKNLEEFNKNYKKQTITTKVVWYINNLIIMTSHIILAVYTSEYCFSILKPDAVNLYTVLMILISVVNTSLIKIYIENYYKKLILC